jgi:hypothetical protein
MSFIDDEFIIVIDEPCHCLHTIYDLNMKQTILHSVKEEGRIKNINLIQYIPPSSCRKRKHKHISDDTYRLYRKMFN